MPCWNVCHVHLILFQGSSVRSPAGNPGSKISVKPSATLPSNISEDSWCHSGSPLPCWSRISEKPSRKHSRWIVAVYQMSWGSRLGVPLWFGISFNFTYVVLENFSTIYSKPMEVLLPSVIMNSFIDPSFMCKGVNRTLSWSVSGIFKTLHISDGIMLLMANLISHVYQSPSYSRDTINSHFLHTHQHLNDFKISTCFIWISLIVNGIKQIFHILIWFVKTNWVCNRAIGWRVTNFNCGEVQLLDSI